ncbi:hypothetical protein [Cupriavidus numazuensis]|uniref:hypothetical protein n=1 Tax=Cupriavidus numazuensis TaxID=221992 RepID=UPI001BA4D226|nr:hypothetical protein [Cupriavidus numazuensis]
MLIAHKPSPGKGSAVPEKLEATTAGLAETGLLNAMNAGYRTSGWCFKEYISRYMHQGVSL